MQDSREQLGTGDSHELGENQAGIRRLIERGTEIAGGGFSSIAATATGFVLGGTEGALLGGAVGSSAAMGFRWLGTEISSRLLGPREHQRIGYVFTLAASEIATRIRSGERVRQDGFFDESSDSWSDAKEVWEGILMKSQREPEEKKLPYMAHLLSSLAFDSGIGVSMAHQLTKAAETLTYRQLCIMNLIVVKDHFALRPEDYRGHGSFSRELLQVLYEYFDLYRRGFVNFGGEVAFGPSDVNPGKTMIQGLGAELFNLMQLREIPIEDATPVAAQLK